MCVFFCLLLFLSFFFFFFFFFFVVVVVVIVVFVCFFCFVFFCFVLFCFSWYLKPARDGELRRSISKEFHSIKEDGIHDLQKSQSCRKEQLYHFDFLVHKGWFLLVEGE